MTDRWRLLPRAWMGVWDVYLAVWVPLKRAWAWVWHRKRLREYDVMLDTWLPMMRADGSVTTCTPGPMRYVKGPPPPAEGEIIYMPSRYFPVRLVPPGRTIANELEARGWTQRHLADAMGCPEDVVSALVDAKSEITPETAVRLASAFGTSAEFWVNLEANYRRGLGWRALVGVTGNAHEGRQVHEQK